MDLHFVRATILGATGPTGKHLASELLASGVAVRVLSRNEDHLSRVFSGSNFERVAADMLSGEEALRAIEGCEVVFDCIGLPASQIESHPATARNVASAVRQA